MGGIVVGVDGSAPSREALRWAVEEARIRGTLVEAVYVYEHTPSWQLYGYAESLGAIDTASLDVDAERAEREAAARAEQLVEGELAQIGELGDVQVETVVLEERRPARALVERSRTADMLVVGTRGRGGFAGLLLGSVSHQCSQHAVCPVVIVGEPDAGEDVD
jgi:nucleotide-binding universal stress UspA family protein